MNRPIGVIDSGVGGLTVAKEIMRQLPHEQIYYLGDTARCPYGPRSPEEVKEFTWQMTRFLLQKNIKMLVIACNTATAVALDGISSTLDIPVVGVIYPGARAALKVTKFHRRLSNGRNHTEQSVRNGFEPLMRTSKCTVSLVRNLSVGGKRRIRWSAGQEIVAETPSLKNKGLIR